MKYLVSRDEVCERYQYTLASSSLSREIVVNRTSKVGDRNRQVHVTIQMKATEQSFPVVLVI